MSTTSTAAARAATRRQRDFLGRRTFLLACWIAVAAGVLLLGTRVPGQQQLTLPTWVIATALVGYLGGIGVLITAPTTWRATAWGWFWIATNPLGMLAFLLLSGPFPGVPAPRDPQQRLSGVRAFTVGLLLSAAVDGLLGALG